MHDTGLQFKNPSRIPYKAPVYTVVIPITSFKIIVNYFNLTERKGILML